MSDVAGTSPRRQLDGRVPFRALLGVLVAWVTAGVAFFVTSPYAVLDWQNFIQATLVEQGAMVRGIADMPFTRQYRNTTPYIYFIQQQLQWGMGWALGLVAAAGTVFAVVQALRALWGIGVSFVRKAQPGPLAEHGTAGEPGGVELGAAVFWADGRVSGEVQPLYEPAAAVCAAVGGVADRVAVGSWESRGGHRLRRVCPRLGDEAGAQGAAVCKWRRGGGARCGGWNSRATTGDRPPHLVPLRVARGAAVLLGRRWGCWGGSSGRWRM